MQNEYQLPESEYNRSLEAPNMLQDLPQFFETRNKTDILRAYLIAEEFEVDYIFYGSGNEYQRLKETKQRGSHWSFL